MNSATLPDPIRLHFRQFIMRRGGLYFRDNDLKNMEEAIITRMRALNSATPGAYYAYLSSNEHGDAEFKELLNLLTVNHTYFFRNEAQFTALRESILPQLCLAKKPQARQLHMRPVLRIWSAGCSTGEEPYTIAMILRECMADIDDWDIQIIATDISSAALEKARSGIYGKSALRLVTSDLQKKYFSPSGPPREERVIIADAIRTMVQCSYLNLTEDPFPADCDIIFCRNVTIYFNHETTEQVMLRMHAALRDEGYLFIGSSESLQFSSMAYTMQSEDDAIYYRKAAPSLPASPEAIWEQQLPNLPMSSASDLLPYVHSLSEVMMRMGRRQYSTAISIIEETIHTGATEPLLYLYAAESLIAQGKYAEARRWLQPLLARQPENAMAYCLMGIACNELGDLETAKVNLKKAVYLDTRCSLAHMFLAQVYRQEGNTEHAIREYRNTLRGLGSEAPGALVPFSGGFMASALMGVCTGNLERMKSAQ